jgi:hypothetical protein
MALDGSYDGLKATIADFLNRTDLAAVIPDFITLAEAQITRRLVGRQKQGLPIPRRMVGRSDAELPAGAEFAAVPGDFHGPVEFVLQGSPESILDYLDPTTFQQWKQAQALAGVPVYYTVVGGEFQFYPVVDKAYTAELTYVKRFPALSGSTATNWILTDYPDAYLYGALVQAAPYLKDDGRVAMWGSLFSAALDDICNADPMPGDKSTLRTEIPILTGLGRTPAFDINSDTF